MKYYIRLTKYKVPFLEIIKPLSTEMCINVSLITNFLQDYFFVDGSENKMPLRVG